METLDIFRVEKKNLCDTGYQLYDGKGTKRKDIVQAIQNCWILYIKDSKN